VTSDSKTDFLRVRYDPARVTAEQMLQVIDKQGYSGTITARGAPNGSPK
jgi:hypothetical protein